MSAADSNSLNWLSWLYAFGAWGVVLGVAMESAEILVRRSSKRRQNRFIGPLQSLPTEPQTPHWAHTTGDLGFVILVIALIFEQVCHQRMEGITDRERNRLTSQLDSTTEAASKSIVLAGQIGTTNAWLVSSNINLALTVERLRKANDVFEAELLGVKVNIAQTSSNMATLNPLKKPITSITATIILELVLGKAEMRRFDLSQRFLGGTLTFGRSEQVKSNRWDAYLVGRDISPGTSGDDTLLLVMEFWLNPIFSSPDIGESVDVESVEKWNVCKIALPPILGAPADCDLKTWSGNLLVNETRFVLITPPETNKIRLPVFIVPIIMTNDFLHNSK